VSQAHVPLELEHSGDGRLCLESLSMAVPKKRTSKMRRRMRRASQKLPQLYLARCSHCGAAIPAHRVCHNCGHYAGKPVIELEEF
jgi:large subunit ribosomal protein L32